MFIARFMVVIEVADYNTFIFQYSLRHLHTWVHIMLKMIHTSRWNRSITYWFGFCWQFLYFFILATKLHLVQQQEIAIESFETWNAKIAPLLLWLSFGQHIFQWIHLAQKNTVWFATVIIVYRWSRNVNWVTCPWKEGGHTRILNNM